MLKAWKTSVGKHQSVLAMHLAFAALCVIPFAFNMIMILGEFVFNAAVSLFANHIYFFFIYILIFLVLCFGLLFLSNQLRQAWRKFRPDYSVSCPGGRKDILVIQQVMFGLLLVLLLLYFLKYTFVDINGPQSFFAGESRGFYGVMFSNLLQPVTAAIYVSTALTWGSYLGLTLYSAFLAFGLYGRKQPAALFSGLLGYGFLSALILLAPVVFVFIRAFFY